MILKKRRNFLNTVSKWGILGPKIDCCKTLGLTVRSRVTSAIPSAAGRKKIKVSYLADWRGVIFGNWVFQKGPIIFRKNSQWLWDFSTFKNQPPQKWKRIDSRFLSLFKWFRSPCNHFARALHYHFHFWWQKVLQTGPARVFGKNLGCIADP